MWFQSEGIDSLVKLTYNSYALYIQMSDTAVFRLRHYDCPGNRAPTTLLILEFFAKVTNSSTDPVTEEAQVVHF